MCGGLGYKDKITCRVPRRTCGTIHPPLPFSVLPLALSPCVTGPGGRSIHNRMPISPFLSHNFVGNRPTQRVQRSRELVTTQSSRHLVRPYPQRMLPFPYSQTSYMRPLGSLPDVHVWASPKPVRPQNTTLSFLQRTPLFLITARADMLSF